MSIQTLPGGIDDKQTLRQGGQDGASGADTAAQLNKDWVKALHLEKLRII